MPSNEVSFFAYLKDTTSHNGDIKRVVTDTISDWMLVLSDGSRLELGEGEDWVSVRSGAEKDGKKFLYEQVDFAVWRDTLTAEQKELFDWSTEDGVFIAEIGDDGLVCSIETGEPLTFEEAKERGLVDEDAIVEDEDEDEEKDPIDLDDIDDDGGDDDEDEDSQS